MDKFIAVIKAHPVIIACVGGLVFIYFLMSGNSSTSTTSASNAAAITASEEASISDASQANAQLQLANDQVNAIGIQASAATAQNANNNAAAVATATLSAQVAAGQTAASLALGQQTETDNTIATLATSAFTTAADNVTNNYSTQVSAAGGSSSGITGLSGNIYAPDGITLNGVYYPHGSSIPTSSGNPADVQEFNGANFSIEQMFNNLIGAVQGQGPVTTATVTQGSATGGSLNVDPMFLNMNSMGQVNQITSVTPGTSNSYGWSGSVTSIGAGQNVSTG
jgi:hypothetical protein